MNALTEPLGPGAVGLLAVVLGISTILALLHLKRMKSPDDFLIVSHNASWWDLIASQVGYYMSMAAGLALMPALAYEFGPLALVFISLYFVSAVVSYVVIINSKSVKEYVRESYGLPGFVATSFVEGSGRRAVGFIIGGLMAIIYWGLFAVELVVLRNVFDAVFPAQSSVSIVLFAGGLVVVYCAIGGFLGTMRTDAVQTFILVCIIFWFTVAVLPRDTWDSLLTAKLFSVKPGAPMDGVIGLGISAVLLGIGYLIPQQDAWSRVSAAANRCSPKKASVGLFLALFAIIPSLVVGLWGVYMLQVSPNLSREEMEIIPGLIIKEFTGSGPVGLLLPCFVAVAISTADTALISSVQAFGTVSAKTVSTVTRCRALTVVFGVIGILVALLSPGVVDAVFALGAVPLSFIPIILLRVFGRPQRVWAAISVIAWGVMMGVAILVIGGEFRNVGPVILFVVAMVVYPLMNLGSKKNA